MLTGRPTKYGSGIEIFGDYRDLRSLYYTVHALAGNENAPGYDIFFALGYDIRKANENWEKPNDFDFSDELIQYRSFKIFWLYFFASVKFMRENARLMETTANMQADIYRLESILETCLKSYDQKIGTEIFEWLTVHHIPKTE